MAMVVVKEEIDEGSTQCTNHPYRNSTPGGICAFCLQEKLGKLISSSFPVAIFPSSSSSPSPSPSFRSDFGCTSTTISSSSAVGGGSISVNSQIGGYQSRLPSVLARRKKEKKEGSNSVSLKRSKSITAPRRGMNFLDEKCSEDYSPNRRGFWSFLYLSKHSTAKKNDRYHNDVNFTSATPSTVSSSTIASSSVNVGVGGGGATLKDKKREDSVVVDENGSPDEAEFDRKVSRSRSVGCGSRSFSGDFFERISTGFGDCALRRVESHREGKLKVPSVPSNARNRANNGQDGIKERVKCGGIFSGFMVTSSSSSYWVSSSAEDNNVVNGKSSIFGASSKVGHISHGRNKSWGWTFASPMRGLSKPYAGKRDAVSSKNATLIPSLLAGRS